MRAAARLLQRCAHSPAHLSQSAHIVVDWTT